MIVISLLCVPNVPIINKPTLVQLKTWRRLCKQNMAQITDACVRHLVPMSKHYASLDDVIKWKHFPRYWPFVWGIHQSLINSPHNGQWRGALMFFICAWTNSWVNNRDTGDFTRHGARYDADDQNAVKLPSDVACFYSNSHIMHRIYLDTRF